MPRFKYMWILAQKDLKLFSKDRLALLFFIVFPIFFITLFSLVMGGEASDSRFVFFMVTQEETGGLSHQIIDSMVTDDIDSLEPGSPVIYEGDGYDEMVAKVENDELAGFLAFPENFTEGVYSGDGTGIEIVVNPSNVNYRMALQGVADAISTQIGAHYVIANSAIELMIMNGELSPQDTAKIQETIQRLFAGTEETESIAAGIRTEVIKTGDIEAESGINWSLTGYLVMFVFFNASLGAEMIVKERQNRTLERILTGSVRREEILGGIFLGTTIKGLIQILIFWVFGVLAFNADLGLSPWAVILLSFIVVLMSSAFSLMLATLVKTQRSASSAGVLCAMILAPLGGCWWPLFILPRWMQTLGKFTPHGWANTGFNKLMLFGAEFGDVIPEMLVLIGFAVVFGAIAIWKFRTMAD